ncbi:MAG: cysteine hydrolase [Clostridia bacterium]|nr:cysteine hydrolase [Clostridia bacterium]
MVFEEKQRFLKNGTAALAKIHELLSALPEFRISELDADSSALVIVDMVNGFAKEGALFSPRIAALIPGIAALSFACAERGIARLAFADCHTGVSPELDSFPAHCMAGTTESMLVDELAQAEPDRIFHKNSTNGFLEENFQTWLHENPQITDFVVVGDCTDLCIQQFACTLKSWFNMRNQAARVVVPVNYVDTYDGGTHEAGLMNATALYNLCCCGIELVLLS